MAVFTEEYRTFSVYLCKTPYVPSGLCVSETCAQTPLTVNSHNGGGVLNFSANGLNLSSSKFFNFGVDVTLYLYKEEYGQFSANVYIIPSDKDDYRILDRPLCDDGDYLDPDSSWSRQGFDIKVKFPELKTCGVTGVKAVYSDTIVSFSEVNHIGEIESELPEFTFNEDGHFIFISSFTQKNLIPGRRIEVFYSMDGPVGWFHLGSFSFQTDIFTGGEIVGCGLCERVKIYDNPAKPEDGYTYKYLPVEGGEGYELNPDWMFDTRLRWGISYYGNIYWLQSVSPVFFKAGAWTGIIKSITSLPDAPDTDIRSTMAKKELSETSDRIVPEMFYQV